MRGIKQAAIDLRHRHDCRKRTPTQRTVGENRSGHARLAVANRQRHAMLGGHFHGGHLQNFRPAAHHLQRFFVAELRNHSRHGNLLGIGGVHAFHVFHEFHALRAQRHRKSHRRGIRSAASERADILIRRNALISGNDRNLSLIENLPHALRANLHDLRRRVHGVRDDSGLRARERHGDVLL